MAYGAYPADDLRPGDSLNVGLRESELMEVREEQKCKIEKGETHVWNAEKIGIEVVHINEPHNTKNKCDDLPDIESSEENEEQKGEARESIFVL